MSSDHPLPGQPAPGVWHPRLYLAELAGTALLVAAGVSVAIIRFLLLSFGPELVRALLSAAGHVISALLNPSVILVFLIESRLKFRQAAAGRPNCPGNHWRSGGLLGIYRGQGVWTGADP